MRFHIKENLFSNRKRLVIVICIVIIIIIAIFGTSTMLDTSSSAEVTAVILVDNEVLRVGETITFDAGNSSGDIETYAWDFGDGSVSDEVQPTHQFEQPGWFNVSLLVIGEGGERDNDTITIGVQRDDSLLERNLPPMINILDDRDGTGNSVEIGPNAGNPDIDIQVLLETVIGSVEIEVWIDHATGGGIIHTQSYSETGGDIQFSFILEQGDLFEEVEFNESYITVMIWIVRGGWQGGVINIDVQFPL